LPQVVVVVVIVVTVVDVDVDVVQTIIRNEALVIGQFFLIFISKSFGL
jgi:hypothetical protein